MKIIATSISDWYLQAFFRNGPTAVTEFEMTPKDDPPSTESESRIPPIILFD